MSKQERTISKSAPIFEVQKFGVTIEFDTQFGRVESAFNSASPGGVVMYKLDQASSRKAILKRR
jgi:hypothetical protein